MEPAEPPVSEPGGEQVGAAGRVHLQLSLARGDSTTGLAFTLLYDYPVPYRNKKIKKSQVTHEA